jgi:hypothetical protein
VFSLPDLTVLLGRLIGVAKVWIWAVPGMVILACYGTVRWYRNRLCRLFMASALTTLVGYLFFPADQGHGWGFRYFHSAWMALPLLATAAVFRPAQTTDDTADSPAGVFEDMDTRKFVAACALLTLVFGVGWRAWEMDEFVSRLIHQEPPYTGTERRIVIIDPRHSFYGQDLVQNDPWLRANETRMISHGPKLDAKMMAQYFPEMHKVYADPFGTVWSTAPQPVRRSSLALRPAAQEAGYDPH